MNLRKEEKAVCRITSVAGEKQEEAKQALMLHNHIIIKTQMQTDWLEEDAEECSSSDGKESVKKKE